MDDNQLIRECRAQIADLRERVRRLESDLRNTAQMMSQTGGGGAGGGISFYTAETFAALIAATPEGIEPPALGFTTSDCRYWVLDDEAENLWSLWSHTAIAAE